MTRREKGRAALLALALLAVLLLAWGLPQRWWASVVERPPEPLRAYLCTNARCGLQFETRVAEGREVRCGDCMWLAKPAGGEDEP